jgi:PleD family two-component response regulator
MVMDKGQARFSLDATTSSPRGPAAITLFTIDESLIGSLEALLRGDRYRLSARSRPGSLTGFLQDRRVDAVLYDLRIPVSARLEIGRDLRSMKRRMPVPIVGICDATMTYESRLAAYEDGFWDVFEYPIDAGELVAKLGTWTWLKRDVDGMQSGLLLDVESGHYTSAGMKRRLREVAALAQRIDDPLSCIVFASDEMLDSTDENVNSMMEAGQMFSLALHHGTRNSDIVGRLEPMKYVVLAPHTTPAGAVRLAERFTSLALTRQVEGDYAVTFSAGVAGVEGRNGQVQACPELLLAAASRALNQARGAGRAQVAAAWGPGN